MPFLSIITVTRNLIDHGRQEAFLSALDCVQAQTERSIEHVILDGASNDGTQGLIESVVTARDHVPSAVPVIYRSEPDTGFYDAMNRAARLAQGRYLLFLNSDAGLASPLVAAQIAKGAARGDPDFLFGPTLQMLPGGATRRLPLGDVRDFLQVMPFSHNAMAIRRDLFIRFGGHDLQYRVAADYDLVMRMLVAGHQGVRLRDPVALFASRGVAGNAMAVGQDYARIWSAHFAAILGEPIDELEALEWYRRGALPMRLCAAMSRDTSLPPLVRQAARRSLRRGFTRGLQPWRRVDNIGA